MNYGEGDQLSEKMSSLGHELVSSVDLADIVVLNTCTVVETTEKKMIRRMAELKKSGKEVIVTGCMAKVQKNRVTIRLQDSLIIPPELYSDFSYVVSERYGIVDPIVSEPTVSNILPIAQGCLGNCTYCITKFARGRLSSYDPDAIIERFNIMISQGVKEILVTAQDTGCYGVDIGTDLPSLIERMLENDSEFRIRIGMMNPNSLIPIADRLMEVMNDPRVYKFLHIPVQSGSNEILIAMKRPYHVEDFLEIVAKVRSYHPEISISTDVISGFPGESDIDHIRSLRMLERLKADTVNITRFSSRPGTEASMMEQIHGRVSKVRSAELTETKNRIELKNNSQMVGKYMGGLVTEIGKQGTVIVRTDNYRPVAVASDLPLNSFVKVRITACKPTYLVGRVLNK